jgi:hypothetical protein
MIAALIAMVVLGVVMLFIVPVVGIVLGAVGLALVVVWLLSAGRRTAARSRP